jgi:transposase
MERCCSCGTAQIQAREGTEGKTLREKQAWYAKLPSVCKRYIFSLLGHRIIAIAIQTNPEATDSSLPTSRRTSSCRWLDTGLLFGERKKTLGWTTKIVQHSPKPRYVWLPKGVEPDWDTIMAQLPPPGFHVLPHRCIVERTFSWLGQNRRLSKDYEQLCETEEAWIYIAMTRLMARRLAAA